MFSLEKSAGNVKSTIAEIFSDLSEKSIDELNQIKNKAGGLLSFLEQGKYSTEQGQEYGIDKNVYKSLSSNPTSLKSIRDLIADLRLKTKNLKEHFKTLFKKDVGLNEFEQSLGAVGNKLQTAIRLTKLFTSSLHNIAEIANSHVLGDIANGLNDISEIAESTMSGAQTGAAFGATGAAVGAALGFISSITGKIAETEKKHREAINKIKETEISQQREYNKLLFEQKKLMKDKESIFGTDEIAKAVGYLALYNESFNQLQNKLERKYISVTIFLQVSVRSFYLN